MNIPKYIERPIYMDRIMPYVRKDIMKILVGQRRVGKSYLLFQLMDRLSALHPEDQAMPPSESRSCRAEEIQQQIAKALG